MELSVLLIVVAILLALLGGAGIWYYFSYAPQNANSQMRSLMGDMPKQQSSNASSLEGINQQLKKELRKKKKPVLTLDERFFRAGFYTAEDKVVFYKIRLIAPIVGGLLIGGIGFFALDFFMGLLAAGLGVMVGFQAPISYLDRKILKRNEEVMFYLPLVIEQVVIGVSSSLDTGPCIQRVVDMAEERNSHNPVTELLRHAQMFAKSGISFEEAMNDVGTLSGHPELKQAFKSLAQVAKHGGEITKQLQELADSVSSQRETKIEGQIKRLELQATAPVGLVFLGFMIILLVGLGANLAEAFK